MKTSVALCTYNGEKFLSQQLDSILNQTSPIDEIVVCDDCSTDSTISILRSYSEKNPGKFNIISNDHNLRSVKNFEKTISLCNNDIIFLCDQDDIWSPNKVEKILEIFEKKNNISAICTNGNIIDENSLNIDTIPVWDFPKLVEENGYIFDKYNILNLVDNFCTGATMAFRKKLIDQIIPIPLIDEMHHDRWIALVAVLHDELYFLDEKLISYRRHATQQVGSVFYENSTETKKSITNYFSIDKKNKNFKEYKKLLRRFNNAYKINKENLSNNPAQQTFFNENLHELKRRFSIVKSEMKSKFPLQSFILFASDQLLGKRKM